MTIDAVTKLNPANQRETEQVDFPVTLSSPCHTDRSVDYPEREC